MTERTYTREQIEGVLADCFDAACIQRMFAEMDRESMTEEEESAVNEIMDHMADAKFAIDVALSVAEKRFGYTDVPSRIRMAQNAVQEAKLMILRKYGRQG